MKNQIIATAVIFSTIGVSQTCFAANSEHLRQLLATKQCQNCNLSGAGLVMADLSGADLAGANLSGANLSRANLSGANLRGANLSGTSLFGANLNSAKLEGANIAGTDLRNSYLMNADLAGVNLNLANLQGAVGIPLQHAKPEEFYAWGVAAAQKGNQQQAIDYFSQAIAVKPDYGAAYLARGIARYQLFDKQGAWKDAQVAEELFKKQQDKPGMQLAQGFIKEIQAPQTAKVSPGEPNLMDFVSGVTSLFLQLLPF